MAEEKTVNTPSGYVFKARSAADDCLEVANIHRREAKQLYEGAQAAEAAGTKRHIC